MPAKITPASKPRRTPPGIEALLREVLTEQARQGVQLASLERQTGEASANAAAARDLASRTTIILEEQDLVSKLGEYRSEARATIDQMRQDVVHAYDGLKKSLADSDAAVAVRFNGFEQRMQKLENDYQQREGIKSFAAWLMKNAPWLLAGIAAFSAGLGFKDKLP